MNATIWICLNKYERLAKKSHKLEQESNLHPPITGRIFYQLPYPIFSPSYPQFAKEKKITQSHCCYLLKFNYQNRRKLFFFWEFVWGMTHSHVHLSTQFIDDRSLFRNGHIAWCREILTQRSSYAMFVNRFCDFRSTSSSFSFSADISPIEKLLHKMMISLENWSGQSFFQWKITWYSRQFSAFAQTLCCRGYSSLHLCLSVSPKHDCRRRSLLMLVPRKKWTVPQLTGVYSPVWVSRNEWPVPQLTGVYSPVWVSRNEWPVPQLTSVHCMMRVPRKKWSAP